MHKFTLPQNLKLDQEWEVLKLIMAATPSEVVLCHNDLQEGNILLVEKNPEKRLSSGRGLCESDEDEIRMIDFEYAAYNYRGFDISQHFNEYCYDYDVEEFPHFVKDVEAYPNREQQMSFFRSYLKTRSKRTRREYQRSRKGSSISEDDIESDVADVDEAELEDLYRETNVFSLFTHLVWSLWSLRQASLSQIQFGFVEYGVSRLQHYLDHKKWLLQEGLINL